jgi:hypothetical protein
MRLPLLAGAVVALLTSCREPSTADWAIDVGIQNMGTNMIKGAAVSWGEFSFRAGLVSPTAEAVHVGFDRPIPETATVHYLLPDGKEIAKTISVKKAIPAVAYNDKDITVMFEVNSNTDAVTVKILHFVEKDGYNQLVPF